jgi:hypothetical protein
MIRATVLRALMLAAAFAAGLMPDNGRCSAFASSKVHGAIRLAPRPSSGSPAWLWDGSVRRWHSVQLSGNHRPDVGLEWASTWCLRLP